MHILIASWMRSWILKQHYSEEPFSHQAGITALSSALRLHTNIVSAVSRTQSAVRQLVLSWVCFLSIHSIYPHRKTLTSPTLSPHSGPISQLYCSTLSVFPLISFVVSVTLESVIQSTHTYMDSSEVHVLHPCYDHVYRLQTEPWNWSACSFIRLCCIHA